MIKMMWENIFRVRGKDKSNIINVLKSVPIFKDLNFSEMKKLKKIIHQRNYDIDEYVFKFDTPGLGMYILIDGEIEIQNKTKGGTVKVVNLYKGDFFGELSLVSDENRTVEAIAKTKCELVAFFRTDLINLIKRSPKLGNKILMNLSWVLGQRLRELNKLNQIFEND
tara:strand:+ start:64 stop:564 length:501 start_codon:yes stop_codon:yes gene_type:complete